MSRRRAAIIGTLLLFALPGYLAIHAPGRGSGETASAAQPPASAPAPADPIQARKASTGCTQLWTRRQQRRYVTRVYRRSPPVTRRKHQRSYVMTRCQHSGFSEGVARRKWHREMRARRRILRRGNAGIGFLMARERGWGGRQFQCLDTLWGDRESGWVATKANSSSGAYGIPQALPGSKMAVEGADWQTNPRTQIRWGLDDYIGPKYGTPCGALSQSYATGSY